MICQGMMGELDSNATIKGEKLPILRKSFLFDGIPYVTDFTLKILHSFFAILFKNLALYLIH